MQSTLTMVLEAVVSAVMLGSRYADEKERIALRFRQGEQFSNEIIIVNEHGLRLGEVVKFEAVGEIF